MSLYQSVVDDLATIGHAGWARVARASKVPMSTLRKVAYRHVTEPRASTIERLRAGIDRLQREENRRNARL